MREATTYKDCQVITGGGEMNCCKNCKHWNTYGSSGGDCEKLINWWQFKIVVESETAYGPHGDYRVEHPVERIETDELFYCNQYEAGEWQG